MDNFFLLQPPYGRFQQSSKLIKFVNKGLRYLNVGYTVTASDTQIDMNTIEQRINFFHLLDGVIAHNIDGDLVELGCFTGQCAMLFQYILQQQKSEKKLYLFDSFNIKFAETGDIEGKLLNNFKKENLNFPVINKGFFENTLHTSLPEKISFVHIDCGFGGNPDEHKEILLYCLDKVYSRMSRGAVCILMDYYDESIHAKGHNANPGVKFACDEFLKDKHEKIIALYGNQYFHGFFRKL